MDNQRIAILVPKHSVKKVKSALEQRHLLDRSVKIFPQSSNDQKDRRDGAIVQEAKMVIPTLIEREDNANGDAAEELTSQKQKEKEKVLRALDLLDMTLEISISFTNAANSGLFHTTKHRNPIIQALEKYLHALPEGLLDCIGVSAAELIASFPSTYSIYKPMLLLPSHTLDSGCWEKFISALSTSGSLSPTSTDTLPISPSLPTLWKSLAKAVGATHIALNTPIPLHTSTEQSNILRSPLNIEPLHGTFGTPPANPQSPTPTDITSAFWVSTTQNGIYQTWAPLYTMFSRGNISEKTRLLNLSSIHDAVRDGDRDGVGSAALDMYVGIGYFAFCYRRAGVRKVVCFELNVWSVEGLRRGVAGNGWRCEIFGAKSDYEVQEGKRAVEEVVKKNDFLIFHESNEFASERLRILRPLLPPIRHVNLGLLPSSRAGWDTAVRALDPERGGWLHVHENIGVGEMEEKVGLIVEEVGGLYIAVMEERRKVLEHGEQRGRVVARLEHVERVKTFAPSVVHCVVDVYLGVEGR